MSHTPGPWKVMEPVDTWISTVGDPYGHGQMHIADVRGWGHLTGQGACALGETAAIEIQKANGSLLASAPDLLAACRAARDYIDPMLGKEASDLAFALHAAIAKAEAQR